MTSFADWLVALSMLLLACVLLVSVTWAAARGSLPPNSFIGIRIGKTDASEEIWQQSHRQALSLVTVAGIVAISLGVTSAFFYRMPEVRIRLVLCGYLALLVIGGAGTVLAYLKARNLYKSLPETARLQRQR